MNVEDANFLAGLFDSEGEKAQKFFCVFKHGHLLLLLPQDRRHSLRALTLYQAQSFKARIYVMYLRCLLFLKAHFLMKSIKFGDFQEPYQFLSENDSVGFLLGNPHSESRKIIAYHSLGDKASVTKFALDCKTTVSVSNEIEYLEKINRSLKGASHISNKNISEDKSYAYYTVDWVDGRTPRKVDNKMLVELMESWIKSHEKVSLGSTDVWQEVTKLTSISEYSEVVTELAEKEVLLATVHGDFSPWNIKINTNDAVKVLDWESYHHDGIAGVDWAHYLVQSKSLISKMWPHEVIDILIFWAKSEEGVKVLDQLGWGDDYLSWIGCYLFYAHYILGYDREELIESWKERNDLSR